MNTSRSVDPCCPSLVAVTVTLPATMPVTTPLELTVALLVSEVDHDTARPVSTFPPASSVAAVSCCVEPTKTRPSGRRHRDARDGNL